MKAQARVEYQVPWQPHEISLSGTLFPIPSMVLWRQRRRLGIAVLITPSLRTATTIKAGPVRSPLPSMRHLKRVFPPESDIGQNYFWKIRGVTTRNLPHSSSPHRDFFFSPKKWPPSCPGSFFASSPRRLIWAPFGTLPFLLSRDGFSVRCPLIAARQLCYVRSFFANGSFFYPPRGDY